MRILGVFFLTWFLLFSSTPSKAAPPPLKQYQDAQKFFKSTQQQDPLVRDLKLWDEAANRLVSFVDSNPENRKRPSAIYLLGRLYEKVYRKRKNRASLSRSVYFYELLAKEYQGNRLADDALLYLGDLRREGFGDDVGARAAYYEIIDSYPMGDMHKTARQRLGLLVRKEIKTAKASPVKQEPRQVLTAPKAQPQASSSSPPEQEIEKVEPPSVPKKKPKQVLLSGLFGSEKPNESQELFSKTLAYVAHWW